MANLRDRLRRIQEQKESITPSQVRSSPVNISDFLNNGWESCGLYVLKRDVNVLSPFKQIKSLPQALPILVPDLAESGLPSAADFLFFDLETSGLSGGAGTTAFLAAFGRVVSGDQLCITQYLLLDYPGENDFLKAVLNEFKNDNSVIVTYNGKCFDSQILKTRCLMNGFTPPVYKHADLLHPARRLWKNIIQDCSQASVETRILGLDRSRDIPGALAPEIWFEFLKTGRKDRLLGICDHNSADISGLASILAAMILIAEDPLDVTRQSAKLNYDVERLALYWRNFILRREKWQFREKSAAVSQCSDLHITGENLLHFAAGKNYPHAAFVYAVDQFRNANYEEGRKRLFFIIDSHFPGKIKAAALRSLAIDSERRLKNINEALEYVIKGLQYLTLDMSYRREFERRKERLEKILNI